MGAQIDIRLESDKYDEAELAPFLGRYFHGEITEGDIWDDKEPFLTKAEAALLKAPFYEEFSDASVRLIDPQDLKAVLIKVKQYLRDHQDALPFEIEVDEERMEQAGLESDLRVNGSRCWMKGDSLYYDVSDKVNIVNHLHEPQPVDIWVDIKDKVEIDGQAYFLKRITRYEIFADIIDKVVAFCELAISRNERIYWLYSH